MDGKIVALRASGIFTGAGPQELRQVARLGDLVEVAAGETLLRAGTRHGGCYLLLSGALATSTASGTSLTSRPGLFVGVAETLARVPACGDIVALRASTVLAFTPAAFAAAVDTVPAVRSAALTQMAVRCVGPAAPRAAVAWAAT
jgi:CRP-like cAMP-binding protein